MAQSSTARGWARGGTVFAATIMVIIGIFQILEGIAAIARDQFFVVANGINNYSYNLATTSWGWIHLGIGVIVGLTGFFLYTGVTWARVIGIILAVVSATANFFFLPYYPLWSMLIIALDIFVIWALATVGRAQAMEVSMGGQGAFAGEAPQEGERWPSANQPAGRHWVGDTSQKEGMREGTRGAPSNAESQAASARGQGSRGSGSGQYPQSGQYPSGQGQSGQYPSGQGPQYPSNPQR